MQKSIKGREVIMTIKEKHDDYMLCHFRFKKDVEAKNAGEPWIGSPEARRARMHLVNPDDYQTVVMTVDYGYDLHYIKISLTNWKRIQAGEPFELEGQHFNAEGEHEQDYWRFNYGQPGSLHVYTEAERDIYKGNISDPEVTISE